jgi:hypothetical protein
MTGELDVPVESADLKAPVLEARAFAPGNLVTDRYYRLQTLRSLSPADGGPWREIVIPVDIPHMTVRRPRPLAPLPPISFAATRSCVRRACASSTQAQARLRRSTPASRCRPS